LEMMALWDLRALAADLPRLAGTDIAVMLVVGDNDKTVSPSEATKVKALLPRATLVVLPSLGHLAHEESPQQTADLILNLPVERAPSPVTPTH
jgi:magnesium chelatase accessory protein